MRIRELYLKAFGPFAERRLVFPAFPPSMGTERAGALPGLCVVYGPNEAGKSSALRAIRDLLYGFPVRTTDDFVHAKTRLRVGARLVFADGEEVGFVRRKGNRETLLAFEPADERGGDETPVDVPRLADLVQAIPANLFDNFYGLDHEELSRGSRALLEDEGELGRALFSAGLGSGSLRRVLEQLDAEAEELFKPSGKNPKINARLAELSELRKTIKERELLPSAWQATAAQVERLESNLSELEQEIETARTERTRLDRMRRTLPALGRRRRAFEEVAKLAESKALAADFDERRRRATNERAAAQENRARAQEVIDRESRRLEALELAPNLLAAREAIESLGERIGAYRDAVEQLPRREAELARLRDETRLLLETLSLEESPGTLAPLRGTLSRATRIRELADQHVEKRTRLRSAEEELETARSAVERHADEDGEEESPREPHALRAVLDRARRLGEIDDRIAAQGREVAAREEACGRSLSSLGLWAGPLERIDEIAFPDPETIEEHARDFEEATRRRDRIAAEIERIAGARRGVEEELVRLRAEGAVPSEAERDAQRRTRDATWRGIRRDLVEGDAPSDSDAIRALSDRFETEIDRADETADRLRIEADRVARAAHLTAQLERLDAEAETANRLLEEAEAAWNAIDSDWRDVWNRLEISPASPAEMRSWLERLRRLRDGYSAVRVLGSEWKGLVADRDAVRVEVIRELEALGVESFDPGERLDRVLDRATELVGELAAARTQAERRLEERRLRAEALTRAEEQRRKRSDALERWRLDWRDSVAGLGLGSDPEPRDAQRQIELLSQLFDQIEKRDEFAERVDKMKVDVERFASEASMLVPRCASDLGAVEPDRAVTELKGRLVAADKAQTMRLEIDSILAEQSGSRAESERKLHSVDAIFAQLQKEADVESEDGLAGAWQASSARAEAERRLAEIEADLAEHGEGRPIAELELEAKGIDPDRLPGQLERIDERIDEATQQRDSLQQELGAQRDALARMDGSEEVARLAATAQQTLAATGEEVRRYATLRMAREILAREIENYRQRNQAPVLGRASALFADLTQGAYQKIESDYSDDGSRDGRDVHPQLVAIADGKPKTVAQLSQGTRDQLFLALRLATLEETLERTEPMPLIADDILVEFDDARSRATLDVLAKLGEKTQILLFSHHRHVADQARELDARIGVIEL